VEYQVDILHNPGNRPLVADVSMKKVNRLRVARYVFKETPTQIVKNRDRLAAVSDQSLDQVTANEPRASRDQDSKGLMVAIGPVRIARPRGTPCRKTGGTRITQRLHARFLLPEFLVYLAPAVNSASVPGFTSPKDRRTSAHTSSDAFEPPERAKPKNSLKFRDSPWLSFSPQSNAGWPKQTVRQTKAMA
jgi:hypothetical protein